MKIVVVGAGMCGLASAWFLQEAGAEVEVIDRADVAAGASWGNAGWISPTLTVPFPEPALLREGPNMFLGLSASARIARQWNPALWSFLAALGRHCTTGSWNRAMNAYRLVNDDALGAYDYLEEHGVEAVSHERRILAAFETRRQSEDFMNRMLLVSSFGQSVDVELLTREAAHAEEPLLSEAIASAVAVHGSRYLDPGAYVRAVADSFVRRGGILRGGTDAQRVRQAGPGVVVQTPDGDIEADKVVLANGAWLDALARPHGVHVRVQAGRGYSFTVDTPTPARGPIYLPGAHAACTPYAGGLRVSGMMEFDDPDAPPSQDSIGRIASAAARLYSGIDFGRRRDEWVGGRPVTPDGLPLIGASKTPGVYIAGGHGMWGMTLGPLTGRLLAPLVMSGISNPAMAAFDPLR